LEGVLPLQTAAMMMRIFINNLTTIMRIKRMKDQCLAAITVMRKTSLGS
jgi:hypothetical protein